MKPILPFLIILFLIFLLFTNLSFAASPANGTISPSSGSSNPNETVIFTTTYTDPDGWANIQFAYLLINTSTNGTNCFYGYYNQNTNRLYLRNDANNRWLGGYAPGSANVIENSYVRLDCAATSVSGTETTLTINWSITFKSPFTGTKNTYLSVRDDTNLYAGWVKKGTWTVVNQSPSVGTVTPESGTSNPNETVSFTTTYTDPDGWLNIQYVYFLINTSTNGSCCFYGYYNQNANRLYLRNDAGTGWIGGYTPGSAYVIENSYVRLNCTPTTVSGLDTTLTITWNITFKSSFTGLKNSYLYAIDDAGAIANWTQRGTWGITNQPPLVGTINPPSGTSAINNPVNFTTTYTDPDSWQNIKEVHFRIGDATLYYNRNSNRLFLRNNNNTGWLGNRMPGSAYVIENMYIRLNCSNTTVSGLDTTLTINWNITFKAASHGTKNTYLYVLDNAGAFNGWNQAGTWTIEGTPPTGSIAINNNSPYTNLTQVTLTLSAADPESGVTEMRFSNDNINWSTPEPYNTTKGWVINTGNGLKTVYVKYKNGMELWSNPISDTIILDTTPPQNTSVTINQGEYTITRNITLTLHAEDVTPMQMMISENQDFSGTSWETYSIARAWVLSNQEGLRTIYARFRDALGNESGIVQDSIILNLYNEMYPIYSPNGERIVYVGDRPGNWDIWVGNTQITTAPIEDTHPTWSPDGTKIAFVTTVDYARGIYIRNSDGTGEISAIQPGVRSSGSYGPRGEIKTYPDWSPKGDSIVMLWKVGNNPTELAIGKTDGTYPVRLGVQNCIWPSFSPDAKEVVYSLQNSPYSRDIYKKVIDEDGDGEPDNLGEITQLTVNGYNNNYPRYSPDGSKIVYSSTDGGSPNIFVMDRDGLNPMQITQNENPTVEYGHPCFSPDGTKIVYHTNRYGKYDIYVRDYLTDQNAYPAAQITQPISFTVVEENIDIIGTANDNMSIDGETVLSALYHYILEYGQGYEPPEWQIITESIQKKQNEVLGTLNINGLSDGIYTVRLRAVDEEGDTGTEKVYIEIHQIPPPQNPSITTAQYTNTRNITLNLSAEGATEMLISEDPNFADSQWEPYATTKEFTLSEGDGQKIIYVKYRNQRNRETQPVSASIILDTTLPELVITPPSYTNQAQINISGTFTEINLASITINGIQATIQDNTFTVQIQLQDEGTNTITVIITDLANNENTYQLTVIRDTTPPQAEITIPFDGFLTNQNTIAVTGNYMEMNLNTITVNDQAAVILEDNRFATGAIQLFEGINVLTATIIDLAGNTAQDTVTVILDTIPPQNPSVSIQQGEYTNNQNITLDLSVQDAVGILLSEDPQFPDPQWEAYTSIKSFTLLPGDGQKTVYIKYRDLAGNETQTVSDSIILDTTPPQIEITNPENGFITGENAIIVLGTYTEVNLERITVNGVESTFGDGVFSVANVPLTDEGNNIITAIAADRAQNSTDVSISVMRGLTIRGILERLYNNFNSIQDMTADMVVTSTFSGHPFGEVVYTRYYYKKTNKTKTEFYDNAEREDITEVVITDNNMEYFFSPVTRHISQRNLAVNAGISQEQFRNMDITSNLDGFVNNHTLTYLEAESNTGTGVYVINAIPNMPNQLYSRLKLWIDINKGLLIKSELYGGEGMRPPIEAPGLEEIPPAESGEELLIETTEILESIEIIPGVWTETRMRNIPRLQSGNFITIIEYSNIQINQGLTDSIFDPERL